MTDVGAACKAWVPDLQGIRRTVRQRRGGTAGRFSDKGFTRRGHNSRVMLPVRTACKARRGILQGFDGIAGRRWGPFQVDTEIKAPIAAGGVGRGSVGSSQPRFGGAACKAARIGRSLQDIDACKDGQRGVGA